MPAAPTGLAGRFGELAFAFRAAPAAERRGLRLEDHVKAGSFHDVTVFRDDQPLAYINVKAHVTPFAQAARYANVPSRSCWAWASYKIRGSLAREGEMHLAAVLSLAGDAQTLDEALLWDHLNAAERRVLELLSAFTLPRALEDAFADAVLSRPAANGMPVWQLLWAQFGLPPLTDVPFRLISAVDAGRLFFDEDRNCQTWKRTNITGSQTNVHIDLARDCVSLEQLLDVLADPVRCATTLRQAEQLRARVWRQLNPEPLPSLREQLSG